MYDFLEYLHRYCIKSINNWEAVADISCKVERGNVSTGYYVKQDRVVIDDNDIPSIIKISGSYIAADILVTRYLDGIGEFIKVSELDQSSYYEWFMFVEETRRIFRGTEIVYQFLKYLFTGSVAKLKLYAHLYKTIKANIVLTVKSFVSINYFSFFSINIT